MVMRYQGVTLPVLPVLPTPCHAEQLVSVQHPATHMAIHLGWSSPSFTFSHQTLLRLGSHCKKPAAVNCFRYRYFLTKPYPYIIFNPGGPFLPSYSHHYYDSSSNLPFTLNPISGYIALYCQAQPKLSLAVFLISPTHPHPPTWESTETWNKAAKNLTKPNSINGRQPQWKTTSMEDNLNGRRP